MNPDDYTDQKPELELDAEERDLVHGILLRRCKEAVAGAADRDSDLADYDDQLNGRGLLDTLDRPAYHHPLSKKSHQQWLANVAQALQVDPLVQVDAINPDDNEEAARLETVLADAMRTANLRDVLLDAAYLAGRDPCAVMYVGWRRKLRPARVKLYIDEETQEVVQEGEQDPSRPYEEKSVTETARTVFEGYDFYCPDLADFYPYPANVQSLETAIALFCREYLTEDDLYNGIAESGFEREAVEDMVRHGPTMDASGNALKQNRDQYDGVADGNSALPGDGFYECYRCYTVLPRLSGEDGEDRVPEEARGLEMVAMLCPDCEIVFRLDYCPYDERPWVRFVMGRVPNRLQGEGHCQMLDGLQAMANSVGQNYFENMETETTPCFYATPDWIQRYGNWKQVPGGYLPREQAGQIEPVVLTKNSRDIMAEISLIEQHADGLSSAPGYGQLSPKVRRVAEMQQVVGETDAKFGLRLQVFFFTLVDIAVKILALHYQYREQQTVTQAELRDKYLFTPVATAQLSTPESRQMLAQMRVTLQQQYIQATMSVPMPMLKRVWHAIRSSYQALGERRPEDYLGPEPGSPEWLQEQPPPMMMGMGMGAPGMPGQSGMGMPGMAPGMLPGMPAGTPQGGGSGFSPAALMGAPPGGGPGPTPRLPIPMARNGAPSGAGGRG